MILNTKIIYATSPASQGGTIYIPHGVTGTKYIVNVEITDGGGQWFPAGFSFYPNYHFTFYIDATNVIICLTAGNSSVITSKQVKILLQYEA